jgi:large conductance mechanosensitive channel
MPMRGLFGEFKAFILRGNVVDLAVGLIIGAAFSGIVTSLVKDVIMPPIAFISGDVDFSDKGIELKPARPNKRYVKPDPDDKKMIPNKAWKPGDPDATKELPNPDYKPGTPELKPYLEPLVWKYGAFIQTVISFLIIGVVLFFIIKGMNSLMRKKAESPPEPTPTEKLLAEIRDVLKNKSYS